MTNYLDRLANLDACAVSDAKDALGLSPAVSDVPRQSGSGFLVGRVKTVQLAAGKPSSDAPKVHLCTRAIMQSDKNTVIVVSHPGIDAGGWGGVLSNAAQMAGVRGVIVDGPTRDIDEARELGFTIYARRCTARTARGRVYEVSTGETIIIDNQNVNDGDYVVADGSGVLFIAQENIEALVIKAEAVATREAAMTADLQNGKKITEVMGADYETMLGNK